MMTDEVARECGDKHRGYVCRRDSGHEPPHSTVPDEKTGIWAGAYWGFDLEKQSLDTK